MEPESGPAPTDVTAPADEQPQWLARHRGLVEVVVLGALLRWAIDLTRIPGVYQDSVTYLRLSHRAPFGDWSPTRPNGYPLILRLIRDISGPSLDYVTAVQHVAGLAVGVLVYVLLVRAGTRRFLATIAAAIVVFDSYAVALEQDVLAETFFTLVFTGSVYLALRRPATVWTIAASGVLLAYATTMRTVALFAIPVWLVWVLAIRPGRRLLLVGFATVLLPLLAYCGVHAAAGNGFSLVTSDGWYLYAKVGPIVDCKGARVPAETRPLCEGPRADNTNFYLYSGDSPAHKLFIADRKIDLEEAMTVRTNSLLRKFSLAVIRAHPIKFAGEVLDDFRRYLGPARPEGELSLYGRPGSVVEAYERWFHMRWWIVTPALVGGAAALALGRRRRELALLVGTAVALLLGSATLSGFNIRYVLPTVPIIVAAGALAVNEALGVGRISTRD